MEQSSRANSRELPALLTLKSRACYMLVLQMQLKSTLFHSLGMTSAIRWQQAKKTQAEGSSDTIVFSFQLFTVSHETEFLMRRSQRGELHVRTCKWTGDPGVVKSSCYRLGSPCFLPKANMRERKAKNRL